MIPNPTESVGALKLDTCLLCSFEFVFITGDKDKRYPDSK